MDTIHTSGVPAEAQQKIIKHLLPRPTPHSSGDFYRVSDLIRNVMGSFQRGVSQGYRTPFLDRSEREVFAVRVADLFSKLASSMNCIRSYDEVCTSRYPLTYENGVRGVPLDANISSVLDLVRSCCQKVHFQMEIEESKKPEDATQHPDLKGSIIPERAYHLAVLLYARAYSNPADPNFNPSLDSDPKKRSEEMIAAELKKHDWDDLSVRQVQWGISIVSSECRDLGQEEVMDANIRALREQFGIHVALPKQPQQNI